MHFLDLTINLTIEPLAWQWECYLQLYQKYQEDHYPQFYHNISSKVLSVDRFQNVSIKLSNNFPPLTLQLVQCRSSNDHVRCLCNEPSRRRSALPDDCGSLCPHTDNLCLYYVGTEAACRHPLSHLPLIHDHQAEHMLQVTLFSSYGKSSSNREPS